MTPKQFWKSGSAAIALAAMLSNTAAIAAEPILTEATSTGTAGAAVATNPGTETQIAAARKLFLLRNKIKYVFVLFQENRSFDHYFGTYPGANGLESTFPGAVTSVPANQTASYNQAIENIDGSFSTLHPFLAPRTIVDANGNTQQLYPESIYSVDHSHYGMATSMHFDTETLHNAANDAYALDNEGLAYLTDASLSNGGTVVSKGSSFQIPPANVAAPTSLALYQKQEGEVAIAHVDCDTIPFMWQWADIGTLFDNFHQTTIGPSTPNAIAMIAAQTGETQWALHPQSTGKNAGTGAPYAVPNETDTAPWPGSPGDIASFGTSVPSILPPSGPDEQSFATCATKNSDKTYNNLSCPTALTPGIGIQTASAVTNLKGTPGAYAAGQIPLTFASLPLSFMGANASSIVATDYHPATDLADVGADLITIGKKNQPVNWGWYQEGYGPEPFDGQVTADAFPSTTAHISYIVHHNGPQYFGYVGDNPQELAHLHSQSQFFTDIANQALPAGGGVFYLRGGYYNQDNLVPASPNPAVQALFAGNDDHGSYSDSQISEAGLADAINSIANSPYWPQSAIIITYDETDGFYDHVAPAIRTIDPTGTPENGGPRIPTIVISPYAAAHTVSHAYSEHGSVIKFINELFNLVPLNQLPNEVAGRKLGLQEFRQSSLGPNDGAGVGDLTEAFDNDRLLGNKPVISASAVTIPAATAHSLPHYNGAGCTTIGITPTDYPNGYSVGGENDPPPADFNPRPTVSVGVVSGAQANGTSYPQNIPSSGSWSQ
jgi:phospholipase C